MRRNLFFILLLILLLTAAGTRAADPPTGPTVIAKPEAFKTLVNPACSHCIDEAERRKADLREDDRVLAWIRGYSEGGSIPYRFFLNPYRVISDSYGVFVYDPDAGFARGFAPSYDFSFYGWRNGVMVMKHKDGTLYSCLSGLAFDGPKKGTRLEPVPTLVSDWGYWLKHYPDGVAYRMFEKYQPVELPRGLHVESVKSRGPVDQRLPEDTPILGVVQGKKARAYPQELLAEQGFIADELDGEPIVVLWEPATKTAAAYRPIAHQPRKFKGPRPDQTGVSPPDAGTPLPPGSPALPPRKLTLQPSGAAAAAPFVDKETGSRWDIAGRAVEGELKGWTLTWVDSTQVNWFAWAAEYPETSIYRAKAQGGLDRGAPRAAGADDRPFEAVLVDPDAVTGETVAAWKKEGFRAVVVRLEDQHEQALLRKKAKAIADHSLDLYFWIEVGRSPALARAHPEWMASLGMHDDWRKRFPQVRPLAKGEVAKAWPWVPITYQEAYDAQLARVKKLLERLPHGYRGVLLNDLQGGPASCGCGNLQCRWATDYGVPSTGTKRAGPGAAARFVAEIGTAAPGKEVIPVWVTECAHEDLATDRQRPKGGWSTGLCGDVNCFETCRKKFAEQWSALHAMHHGPTGLLFLHREFQRDRKEYGGPGGGVTSGMKYLDEQTTEPFPRQRLWLVVQGYDVSAAEEAAARRATAPLQPGVVLVARTRIDQSYEPRIVKVQPAP